MFTNEDLFLSEVHIEDCPPGQGEWTTDFTGVCHFLHTSSSDESCDVNGGQSVGVCLAGGSSQAPGLDEDGDLVVPRGKCRNPNCFSWKVQHCRSTTLRDVGTQVWRGAVLLAEYILSRRRLFQDQTVVEFGCGVGFLGMAIGHIARRVYLTDHHTKSLNLAEVNLKRNGIDPARYRIRHIDWFKIPSLSSMANIEGEKAENYCSSHDWCKEDFTDIALTEVFLAADVVFDNKATDAFLSCLKTFMDFSYSHGHSPQCLVAVERRINFTMEDLEARAPAYEYFMQFIQKSSQDDREGVTARALFRGDQLSANEVPKVFDVERSAYLELWKLRPLLHHAKNTTL